MRGAARRAGRSAAAPTSCWSPRARATATASRSPPTTSSSVLEERLGEDARVTILGHVQRGGAPSAFDRYMGTVLGLRRGRAQLLEPPDEEPQLIGIRGHRLIRSPLMDCVATTQSIADVIADRRLRQRDGDARRQLHRLATSLLRTHGAGPPATAPPPASGGCGWPCCTPAARRPGMNTAVRVAVRVGMDRGHPCSACATGSEGCSTARSRSSTG